MTAVPNIGKLPQQPSSQQASDVMARHAIAPELDALVFCCIPTPHDPPIIRQKGTRV